MSGPVDSAEVVYVVTSDDLPVSVQLLHYNGTLQPQILPRTSQPSISSAISVYDGYGHDITGDVMIEAHEYSVDKNGVVCALNTSPNTILPSNCLACVSSTGSEEFLKEPNLVTNLKTSDIEITYSQDSSPTDLHDVQANGPERDKIDHTATGVASVPVSDSFGRATTSNCVEQLLDDHLLDQALTLAMTVNTDDNTDVPGTTDDENPLSLCMNDSPLSHRLYQNHSVPLLPENLCYDSPDDIKKPVNLAADHHCDCKTTCQLPVCLSDTAKYTTTTTETAVASCEVLTNVNSCDTFSSSTVKHLPPCTSSSAECCLNSCLCEHTSLCQQSASQSGLTELNSTTMSAVCLLTDSSFIVSSVPSFVSVVADTASIDNAANSSSCTHPERMEIPVTESVIDHKLDSSEIQFADQMQKPSVSDSGSPEHGICPSSPVSKSCLCILEQHSHDHITAVSKTHNSPSDLSVCGACLSMPNHVDVSDCGQILTIPDHADIGSKFDVPLIDSERAEQCVAEIEVPSYYCISAGVIGYNEAECLLPSAEYDASDVKESVQQNNILSMNTNIPDHIYSNKREMLSNCSISVDVADHSETESSLPAEDFDCNATKDSLHQKDVTSSSDVMNTNDLSNIGSSRQQHNFTDTVNTDRLLQPDCSDNCTYDDSCTETEMLSASYISVGVIGRSKAECSSNSADYDASAVEESVKQNDTGLLSVSSTTNTNFPDDICSNKREMLSNCTIVVDGLDHSKTESLVCSADYDGSDVTDSVQQKDVISLSDVMNTGDLDDQGSNGQEQNFTGVFCMVEQRTKNNLSNSDCTSEREMPPITSVSVDEMGNCDRDCLFSSAKSADFDISAAKDSLQQTDIVLLSGTVGTDDLGDMDCRKSTKAVCSISVDAVDYNETESSLLTEDFDSNAVKDSVQQKDVSLLTGAMNAGDPNDTVNCEHNDSFTEMLSSSVSIGVMDLSEVECSLPAVDYDSSADEDFVQQKNMVSESDAMNTNNADDMGTTEIEQNFTDTANTDYVSQPDCAKSSADNGSCVNDMMSTFSSNLSSTLDTIGSFPSKDCSVSEFLKTDMTDCAAHIMDQEFDVTGGNADSHLQPSCTTSPTYNGCQRGLLKTVGNFSDELHKMRQKLCVLRRTKHHLKKFQQNKPPTVAAGNTDQLQMDQVLDLLHDANYSKRLRLEAIDRELTERAISLQHSEEQMNLRLKKVEQYEQALRKREQLLAQAQCCTSTSQQEEMDVMTGVQVESVQEHSTAEYKSVVAECSQDSTSRHLPQRCRSCRPSKQKVFPYYHFRC